MLTPLGKALRKLRIERGWLLKEMADGAGVTPSFLSGVETGRKSVPSDLIKRINRWAGLAPDVVRDLERQAELSRKEFKVGMPKVSNSADLQAAALLARFGELPPEDREHIRDILLRRLG